MVDLKRYTGRLLIKDHDCGFIRLVSVKMADGSPHDLVTSHDIFVHQDDCSAHFRSDMELTFEVGPDERRGGDALRASSADELVSGELVLVGADGSRELADPRTLYVEPTPAQQYRMKPIAPEEVEKVLANAPMPMVSRRRERPESAEQFTNQLMARLFPQFVALAGGVADLADEKFDKIIEQSVVDHRSLGMEGQIEHMMKQVKTFKGLRTLLRDNEDLLRPESLIPIKYLPDLFMAAPVWYFWTAANEEKGIGYGKSPENPVHWRLRSICDLVPGNRWKDTFLMFNRRIRTLADYRDGDIIPPKILERMKKVAPLFDHLVIMTPYHDVVAEDWQKLIWTRNVDPYVVGFIKGIPLMFVVGRFSDSGTFPLYCELLADTIAFLRTNMDKLIGFNSGDGMYWYAEGFPEHWVGAKAGTSLVTHTKKLLAAFDNGTLFDWLRGEDEKVPARS